MQKIQSVRAQTLGFRRGMCAADESGGNHRAGVASAQSFAPHAYFGGAYGVTNAQSDFNGQVANAGKVLDSASATTSRRRLAHNSLGSDPDQQT